MTNPCDLPCPKCGSADVYRRFTAKGARMEAKEFDRNPHPRYMSGQSWSYIANRDFIVHHCRCCQYEWATAPLRKPRRSALTQSGDSNGN